MKYLKKTYESFLKEKEDPDSFAKKLVEIVQKSIFDNLGKIHLDDYVGDHLYKKDKDGRFTRIKAGWGNTTWANEYEKKNTDIEYRYSTTFRKKFSVTDKSPINKQIKTYEKHLALFNSLKEVKEKLDKVTYYCEINVHNVGKTFITIDIKLGFSEEMFMGKAMRKVNNLN